MGIVVEVVANSVADCRAIERAGAGRIELCSGIVAGGITPTLALYQAARRAVSLPIMVMIRPREGGFFYSEEEFALMAEEIKGLRPLMRRGDGFVFGCLHADGSINAARMSELAELCGDQPRMCHRAFDVTPDPFEALEKLIDAGICRVLTSGQMREITEGLPIIKSLLERANGRIEVQPCEGIRTGNVGLVLESLFRDDFAPPAIHFGPFRQVFDPTSRLGTKVEYGAHVQVVEEEVRGVVDAVRAFA